MFWTVRWPGSFTDDMQFILMSLQHLKFHYFLIDLTGNSFESSIKACEDRREDKLHNNVYLNSYWCGFSSYLNKVCCGCVMLWIVSNPSPSSLMFSKSHKGNYQSDAHVNPAYLWDGEFPPRSVLNHFVCEPGSFKTIISCETIACKNAWEQRRIGKENCFYLGKKCWNILGT